MVVIAGRGAEASRSFYVGVMGLNTQGEIENGYHVDYAQDSAWKKEASLAMSCLLEKKKEEMLDSTYIHCPPIHTEVSMFILFFRYKSKRPCVIIP